MVEITENFEERYQEALDALHRDIEEYIPLGDGSGIIVAVKTGAYASWQTDGYTVVLEVHVPTRHLDGVSGDDAEMRYLVGREWGEDLQRYLVEQLSETADKEYDPDRSMFFVHSDIENLVGSVQYGAAFEVSLENIVPEGDTVYEVVHRETKVTKVCVSDDDIGGTDEGYERPEDIISKAAARIEADDSELMPDLDEVVGIREVDPDSSGEPPEALVDKEGYCRPIPGKVYDVGARTVVAAGNLNLYDVETGEWVMRFGDSDRIRNYDVTPAEWQYRGRVDRDLSKRLSNADADINELVAETDIVDAIEPDSRPA